MYQTYTVVIRNLKTFQSTFYNADMNGHALSVAPPNLGPKSTPNYEATLGQPSVFTSAGYFFAKRSFCQTPSRRTSSVTGIRAPPA